MEGLAGPQWSPENPEFSCSHRRLRSVSMKTPSAAGLILIAVVLAGCQTDGYAGHTRLASSMLASSMLASSMSTQVGHAKTAKRLKHVKRAATHRRALKTAKIHRRAAVKAKAPTNRPALGLELLGEDLRVVVLQERLRGLCEVVKAERLSADSWRATCAKGGAFVVKIYPDGFMSMTRS